MLSPVHKVPRSFFLSSAAVMFPPFRSGGRAALSVSARACPFSIPHSWRMRGGIHVLPPDQAVLEGENVDTVPFHEPAVALGLRRPLADDEAVARVEPAACEPQARRVAEDPCEVFADGVALDALVRRPVVEDEVRRVHRDDRVHVLTVPGVVVALDRLLERLGAVGLVHSRDRTGLRRSTRSSPVRRVTPSASNRSSRSWAGFRETPSRSRKRARVIRPVVSSSATSTSRARAYADGATA